MVIMEMCTQADVPMCPGNVMFYIFLCIDENNDSIVMLPIIVCVVGWVRLAIILQHCCFLLNTILMMIYLLRFR